MADARRRLRHHAHLCATATVLAGILFASPASGQASDAAYALATRLGAAMERCWFAGGDRDFGDYVYSPEPNATGGPRILVVPRASPDGLPVLVIQITAKDGKPHVNVYGPLAAGAAADRIGIDLRRWIGGGDGCG